MLLVVWVDAVGLGVELHSATTTYQHASSIKQTIMRASYNRFPKSRIVLATNPARSYSSSSSPRKAIPRSDRMLDIRQICLHLLHACLGLGTEMLFALPIFLPFALELSLCSDALGTVEFVVAFLAWRRHD